MDDLMSAVTGWKKKETSSFSTLKLERNAVVITLSDSDDEDGHPITPTRPLTSRVSSQTTQLSITHPTAPMLTRGPSRLVRSSFRPTKARIIAAPKKRSTTNIASRSSTKSNDDPNTSRNSSYSNNSDSNDPESGNELECIGDSDVELMMDNAYDDNTYDDKTDRNRIESLDPLRLRLVKGCPTAEYLAAQCAEQQRLTGNWRGGTRNQASYKSVIKGKRWCQDAEGMKDVGCDERNNIARIMETQFGTQLHGKDRCTSCQSKGQECWIYSVQGARQICGPGRECARCRSRNDVRCSLLSPLRKRAASPGTLADPSSKRPQRRDAQLADNVRLPWAWPPRGNVRDPYIPAIDGKWWSLDKEELGGLTGNRRRVAGHVGRIMETELGEQLPSDQGCQHCLGRHECWVYSEEGRQQVSKAGSACARCRWFNPSGGCKLSRRKPAGNYRT